MEGHLVRQTAVELQDAVADVHVPRTALGVDAQQASHRYYFAAGFPRA